MDKETVMGSALGPMDEDAGAVGLADATTASTMTAIVQRRYGMHEDRAQQLVARVFARRRRHRRRPLPVRIAVALAGFVLLALAAVLVLLPEVGLPALFGALALLALEFDWAARLLGGAVRLAERVRGRFVSLPTLTRLAVIAIPVLIVVTAVVLVTSLGVSPI
jgi:Putative transmembrane protein (PGPGW)